MTSGTAKVVSEPKLRNLLRRTAGRVSDGLWATLGEVVLGAASRRRLAASDDRDHAEILVLRNNDLGDLLVITPLFEALRRLFPSAGLVAAVGSWARPILTNNPYVSEVLTADAPWFNSHSSGRGGARAVRWLLGSAASRQIRARRFGIGIDVLGSTWGALLLVTAGVRERLGTRGFAGGARGFTRSVAYDPAMHVGRAALRFAELLGAIDLPENRPQIFLAPEERAAGEQAWRDVPAFSAGKKLRVVIGPGAGVAARAWAVGSFRELVKLLAVDGRFAIAVVGGPGEKEIVTDVAGQQPAVWPFPGDLSLRQTFALVAAADIVVCNSSMLLHVAAAFRRPTVAVLGDSFQSAAQHQRQWGYDETCWSLGREASCNRGPALPDEVAGFVTDLLPRLGLAPRDMARGSAT